VFQLQNLGAIFAPAAPRVTRRHFSRGLAGSAALPGLVSLGPFACVDAYAQGAASGRGAAGLPGPTDDLLARLESAYKDIHANPELSMQERRTADIAANWLRQQGYEVTDGVGGTGVVGLLRNGDGPTVLMRADTDALPMAENTGLPYASTKTGTDPSSGRKTGIAHSCGHDMHVTWLMGATRILAANRDKWRGTVMAVFQPGEETGEGARAMVEDGLTKRFPKPAVALAQHVLPLPAGYVAIKSGLLLSQSDSLRVTMFGAGGHGSSPETTIDPVVMAAATVSRLQTVVSREIGMTENAVVTVGSVQAGSSANIIPDEAVLQLNIRTFNDQVRETVLSTVKRIVHGEATTSGAPKPPEITTLPGEFPLTINDEHATPRVAEALRQRFGAERVRSTGPTSASEDFSVIPRAWGDVPYVYWIVGGIDPQRYAEAAKAGRLNQIPSNHSPEFAPVINPTLRVGVEAMLAAGGVWLTSAGAKP
jgi:hippurate hydrolase